MAGLVTLADACAAHANNPAAATAWKAFHFK
jgi:hypothetical protein